MTSHTKKREQRVNQSHDRQTQHAVFLTLDLNGCGRGAGCRGARQRIAVHCHFPEPHVIQGRRARRCRVIKGACIAKDVTIDGLRGCDRGIRTEHTHSHAIGGLRARG